MYLASLKKAYIYIYACYQNTAPKRLHARNETGDSRSQNTNTNLSACLHVTEIANMLEKNFDVISK